MADRTILILGGGIGGIVAARELRRHLDPRHRIVLVDRNETFSFHPSYLWVMLGWRKPESIEKPISLLALHGIEFHRSEITKISTGDRTVQTSHATFNYDYLVVALGAEYTAEPEWPAGAGHSFYTAESAASLSKAIAGFGKGAIAIAAPGPVLKSPAAVYEAALLLESYFTRKGAQDVKIKIYTSESSPFQAAGPETGRLLDAMLRERGIETHYNSLIRSADPKQMRLIVDKEPPAAYDMLITVPSVRAPEVLRRTDLAGESGWIPVDENTLQSRHKNVFAIGDATEVALQDGDLMPKTGIIAHNQAEIVAFNIAQEINGTGIRKTFTGSSFYFFETGNGRAAYIHGSFFREQEPKIAMNEPSVAFHWGKVVYEKYWLWRWF